MSDTTINGRKQYWQIHVQAAQDLYRSIADYVRLEGLKPKNLCSRQGILACRVSLDDSPGENNGGFVRVIAPPVRPLDIGLVLRNGVRSEWHGGDLEPEQLDALVLPASPLPCSAPQATSISTCTGHLEIATRANALIP